MALDILFRVAKNSNVKIEENFGKFFKELNNETSLSDARKLAIKYGVLERVNLTSHSYKDEKGKKRHYIKVVRTDIEMVNNLIKHNHLLKFFEYGENLSKMMITREQVKDCITACKEVLSYWGKEDFVDVAKEKMPTQSGFFFGPTEYDEGYKECLEEDLEYFKYILEHTNWDEDILILVCWW